MRYDRKATQRRRVKLLKSHPIADHMLDIVRHHGEHEGRQIHAIAWRAKGFEASGLGQGFHEQTSRQGLASVQLAAKKAPVPLRSCVDRDAMRAERWWPFPP